MRRGSRDAPQGGGASARPAAPRYVQSAFATDSRCTKMQARYSVDFRALLDAPLLLLMPERARGALHYGASPALFYPIAAIFTAFRPAPTRNE